MPSRALDVGSGSGILALAALRLGVERADCLDTDAVAVEATLANAATNGLAERLTARRGTLPLAPDDAPYPLVLANLVAAVLVELAAPLAAHAAPGGTLVASGIIEGRADEVLAALTAAGFTLVERLDDGEWVSLRLARG
jgi:ribosomal protein L11 methyltransferase